MEYTIEIPNWHPTPLNQLMGHWGKSAKMKAADRKMVWAYCYGKVPEKQIKRSVELTVILEPKQRACDPDAYFKSLLDALVHCGTLWNDNDKYCVSLPVKYERADKKASRIVIRDLEAV